MKKTLTLLVLTGLMLTGCGGNQADKQAAPQPTETATATATPETVTVPSVMSLTLDEARINWKISGSRSTPWTSSTAKRSSLRRTGR